MSTLRRPWVLAVGIIAVLAVGAITWFALDARSVYTNLSLSRDGLLQARDSLETRELAAAQESLLAAAEHAQSAASAVDGPLWTAAAALPVVGATPEAVRAVTTALDQALAGLAPATTSLGVLDPGSLVSPDGQIDLAVLTAAEPALQTAHNGITQAQQTLAGAPSSAAGDLVIRQVDDAAIQLSEQLEELDATLSAGQKASTLLPPILGADGPKRYFLAILNPNEARGTGGFLGTYAILRAAAGKVSVEEIGSNSDLPTLEQLPDAPADLGPQYANRYSDNPTLIGNMNLSPHHPAAARNWLAAWEQRTGDRLDGAFSADVVALGDLLTATGQEVALPDGGSLTGEELAQFALSGIYEKFPQPGESLARKVYQEEVTRSAVEVIKNAPDRLALARAMGAALEERRIQLWSADDATQQAILEQGLGGTLRVPEGHDVAFVAINISGSKLDAFLDRSLTYTVGRCVDEPTGQVASTVTVSLTNAIPEGQAIPEYMISLAERSPAGPVNRAVAQLHLPLGAEIDEVFVDDRNVEYSTFLEQDRPSMLVLLDLPPRQVRSLRVEFTEPAGSGPASAPVQPLASDQATEVFDRPCAS